MGNAQDMQTIAFMHVVTPQNHCILGSGRNPVHFDKKQPAFCTSVQVFIKTLVFICLCEFSGIIPDIQEQELNSNAITVKTHFNGFCFACRSV